MLRSLLPEIVREFGKTENKIKKSLIKLKDLKDLIDF